MSDQERMKNLLKYTKENQKTLDEILVTGSTYNRTSLKKRLVDANLLKYICDECGNNGNHRGKPLTLQLNHINGINNDNRLKNLRFLCPNCHSQTPTFAGRSLKKERTEPKGHGEKWKEYIVKQRKVERPLYEELTNEVKKHGYSATGRKYGVSDNAIRKWIKYYEKFEL